MDQAQAIEALSALAHPSRLSVFRMLVRAGDAGLAAGAIARESGLAPSTLSTHLALLSRARLVAVRRDGRSLVYSTDLVGTRALLDFLVGDCCGGRPEICAGLGALACAG